MIQYLAYLTGLDYESNVVVTCHFASFPLAILFNEYKTTTSWLRRDNVSALIGVITLLVGFRWSSIHFLLHWLLGYMMLRYAPKDRLGVLTCVVSVGYVMAANAYKFIYLDGEYTLDYTGTLMLGTMKLTTLAFSVQDSLRPGATLTNMQRKYVLREEVHVDKHFNYYFSFLGIFFGPFIFYKHHERFMYGKMKARSDTLQATKTLLQGLAWCGAYAVGLQAYPIMMNCEPGVLQSSFLYRNWILYVTMLVVKSKYYFIWLTAESLCMFAGLHRDENNESIIAIVKPCQTEFATTLRHWTVNWNMYTARWLRFTFYERLPSAKMLLTFTASALWHGFYPGYLLMFVPLALHNMVNKKVHQILMPKLTGSSHQKMLYTLISWLFVAMTLNFNALAFVLLHASDTFIVQSGMYFYPHLISLLLFVLCSLRENNSHAVPSPAIPIIVESSGHEHQD